MGKLRVLSLFAGIGGFDLGLERTGGFETVAVAELDPYASKVLALRFPNAPNVGDVTTAEYPDADVICAGFPCQDISFAGAGAGLAGARSGLWREVVRAVRVVRPRVVILENVAALLGRGLDVVLRDLAEVGYDAEWHCIPASAVGAPHRRDRIWIVAHACDDGHGADDRSGEDTGSPREARREGHQRQRVRHVVGGGRAPLSGELAELLADAPCELRDGRGHPRGRRVEPANGCEDVAHSGDVDVEGQFPRISDAQEREGPLERSPGPCCDGVGWWAVEPDVGRVAHGIPKRVDRLRCLGNAVVPQIPELIGHAILASLNDLAPISPAAQTPGRAPTGRGCSPSPAGFSLSQDHSQEITRGR